METDQQDTGIPEDNEDDISDTVAKGIVFGIGERSGDEVEREVEVC